MRPAVGRGLGIAEGVLGAGLLVLPPVAAGVAGAGAPAAWVAQLLIGASVAALLGLLAARRGTPGGLPDLLGAVLGPAARRLVVAVYLVGFTVGQAALALVAGRLLYAALGRPPTGAGPLLSGAAVLALGVAGSRLTWSTAARRIRLAAVLAVALVGCGWPAMYAAAGLLELPGGDRWAVAVFLLFFASVGWESAGRSPGPGRVLPATAVALVAVGLAELTLAVLLDARAGVGDTDLILSLRVAAAAGSVTLAAYVSTNLAAVLRFGAELGAPTRGSTAVVAALAAAGAMVGADALGWGVTALLLVPCLATWTAYLLGCVAAGRDGDLVARTWAYGTGGLLILLMIVSLITAGRGPPSFPGNV